MIEYLEGLLEQKGQEQKVLELAEEMLAKSPRSSREVLALQTAILRARTASGQYDLAVTPGLVAVEMAASLQEWDYFGVACLYLGISYGVLQQYELACKYHLEYIRHFEKLQSAATYLSPVWYNLGMSYLAMNQSVEASRAFGMAVRASWKSKNDRREHGIRQALAFQYLRTKEQEKVPGLLVKCGYFLRHHNEGSAASQLFHYQLRTEFAMNTGRLGRAHTMALRGLKEGHGNHTHMATLHLQMARLGSEQGDIQESMAHALIARYCARKASRGDLETEASKFAYEVVREGKDDLTPTMP